MATSSPASPHEIEFLPEPGTEVRQLFILLHGVGGTPANLVPLAEAVRGVSEDNRPERVAQALPPLEAYVKAAQARFGLLQSDTALAGFSQGAIMALELVQAHDGMAGRVIAFSGRYAQLPKAAPQYTTLHLLHGADDPVMPVALIQAAQARLDELHGDSTIDVATHVGHELHPALIQRAIVRLQTCVPLRSWEAALGLNQSPPDGATLH
ncbi:esterase [Achromobacter xylosoxidans]|uniref:esterase n=1 Tax=Alcaligenes xylosoxydans xylosoxydans TaxID=85698 RepID=UPI0038FCC812